MEGHGGPGWIGFLFTLPLYFITFFLSFFPWSLRMPAALKDWWPSRNSDLLGWYLLTQAAVVFGVFTLVRTKLPHYTLPAFPLLALWLAFQMARNPNHMQWVSCRVVIMCALAGVVTLGLFKPAQSYFVAANLWRQCSAYCPPHAEFASVDFDEPSLVWEFRRGITNYMQRISFEQSRGFLAQPGPRILIMPTRMRDSELWLQSTNLLTFRAAGIDTARFRRLDLTAVIKPE
jgi:hypothetical protein